jgi:peptidoglycan hydrolase-like protein with peptidoglycan-binding domain
MGRWTIPTESAQKVLREGSSGVAVWSLQRALNAVGFSLVTTDGSFGPATKDSVLRFQEHVKANTDPAFATDGIAGNGTQKQIAKQIIGRVEGIEHSAPGLLDGFAEGEGAWWLDAVNSSIAGGTDCGLFQRRVYQPDYGNDAVIERAFDTSYQADLLAKSLVTLRSVYLPRLGTNDHYGSLEPREKAWRLAALYHNYPTAAERLSLTPIAALDSYWSTRQQWVVDGMTWIDKDGLKHRVTFPDGKTVDTPLDWCALYSGVLGLYHGSRGSVTRYVSVWP